MRRHVKKHAIDSNVAATEEMLSWVRSVRVDKRRAQKSEHANIRNVRNVFVN